MLTQTNLIFIHSRPTFSQVFLISQVLLVNHSYLLESEKQRVGGTWESVEGARAPASLHLGSARERELITWSALSLSFDHFLKKIQILTKIQQKDTMSLSLPVSDWLADSLIDWFLITCVTYVLQTKGSSLWVTFDFCLSEKAKQENMSFSLSSRSVISLCRRDSLKFWSRRMAVPWSLPPHLNLPVLLKLFLSLRAHQSGNTNAPRAPVWLTHVGCATKVHGWGPLMLKVLIWTKV